MEVTKMELNPITLGLAAASGFFIGYGIAAHNHAMLAVGIIGAVTWAILKAIEFIKLWQKHKQ